jgi:beta-lactamase regulating signal transducer with metallopeptidase domain/biopolymer transport protein ExbD
MHPILSHLLTSWPWTTTDLVNHLWQSTVVGLVVLVLLTVCGRLPARIRRTLAGMGLAKFVVPASCFAWLFKGTGDAPGRWLASHPLTLPEILPAGMFTPVAFAAPAPGNHFTGLLVVAGWLAVCGLLIAFWLRRSGRIRRGLLARAAPVSATLERRIEAAALRAGLRRTPGTLAVESDIGPGVVGIISPVIILPCGLEATLAPAELESVLIHECIHLRRRDNVWSALQLLMVSVFWFNPVVWLLHRRLGIEMEKSCDERVLEITGDPESYAGGIVKSVRHALGLVQPGWAGVTTPPVIARIKNIFAFGSRPRRPLAHGAALGAGVLVLALSSQAGSIPAGSFVVAANRNVATNTADPAVSATSGVSASAPNRPASQAAITSEASNTVAASNDAKESGSHAKPDVRIVKAGSEGETTIGLSHDGRVSFNGQPVTLDQFIVAIREVGGKDKNSPVLIQVNYQTPYGQLFWVLDECRKVGLTRIEFLRPTAKEQ